jgi:phage pi2 protein 07
LMGHDTGLKRRYAKLTPEDLLEGNDKNLGYAYVMEYLTINDENRLKRENEILKVRKSEYEALKEQQEQAVKSTAELKASVAFLSDKVNAAILASPHGKLETDQNRIPKKIHYSPPPSNKASCPFISKKGDVII